jgi:hypothetical protein
MPLRLCLEFGGRGLFVDRTTLGAHTVVKVEGLEVVMEEVIVKLPVLVRNKDGDCSMPITHAAMMQDMERQGPVCRCGIRVAAMGNPSRGLIDVMMTTTGVPVVICYVSLLVAPGVIGATWGGAPNAAHRPQVRRRGRAVALLARSRSRATVLPTWRSLLRASEGRSSSALSLWRASQRASMAALRRSPIRRRGLWMQTLRRLSTSRCG